MLTEVKKDVVNILNDAIIVLEDGKYDFLKELSNHTVHSATVYQDEDTISIAVLVYAIYKAHTRKMLRNFSIMISLLKKSRHYLAKNDVGNYRRYIHMTFKTLAQHDDKLKLYVEEVISKAKMQKGSKLIEHGLSVAKASELIGISQWDLMSYLGKTQILDERFHPANIKQRLRLARSLFR